MKTKNINFDCIKMKNDIQKMLKKQFETNKDKYDSYYDFIIKKQMLLREKFNKYNSNS